MSTSSTSTSCCFLTQTSRTPPALRLVKPRFCRKKRGFCAAFATRGWAPCHAASPLACGKAAPATAGCGLPPLREQGSMPRSPPAQRRVQSSMRGDGHRLFPESFVSLDERTSLVLSSFFFFFSLFFQRMWFSISLCYLATPGTTVKPNQLLLTPHALPVRAKPQRWSVPGLQTGVRGPRGAGRPHE